MKHLKAYNELFNGGRIASSLKKTFDGMNIGEILKVIWKEDERELQDILNIAKDEDIRVDKRYENGDIKIVLINNGEENFKDICGDISNRLERLDYILTITAAEKKMDNGFIKNFKQKVNRFVYGLEDNNDYKNITKVFITVEHYKKAEVSAEYGTRGGGGAR